MKVVGDPDRVSVLLSLAEDKVQILEEKRELFSESDKVGCKYIYIFAADNSEKQDIEPKEAPMWTPDYDPYDEDETNEKVEIHKLVNYYINELKFRYVTKKNIETTF